SCDRMAVAGSTEDTSAMGGHSGSDEAMMFVSMQDVDNRNLSTIDFVESIEKDIEGVNKDADISLSTQAAIGGGEANTIIFTMSDKDTDRLEEATKDVK